jgi:hypothetical protein
MEDFNLIRSKAIRRYNEQKLKRIEFRNGTDTDNLSNDNEEIEYTVQFLVETKKEEVAE